MNCNQSSAVVGGSSDIHCHAVARPIRIAPFDPAGQGTGAPLTVRASPISDRHPAGFIIAPRGDYGLELIRGNKNAFVLLYVIAQRARWRNGFNTHDLKPGQAFLGDHDNYGMSEREYRTAKHYLQKHGFATFKATNKGTIATIVNIDVFDCNAARCDGPSDRQPTDSRQAHDGPQTTNEEGKTARMEECKYHRLIASSKRGSKGGNRKAANAWYERLEEFCAGYDELERTGRLFRLHYKADPDGWERVLADAEGKKKNERLEFTVGPGAYLTYLAKLFGVKLYSAEADEHRT